MQGKRAEYIKRSGAAKRLQEGKTGKKREKNKHLKGVKENIGIGKNVTEKKEAAAKGDGIALAGRVICEAVVKGEEVLTRTSARQAVMQKGSEELVGVSLNAKLENKEVDMSAGNPFNKVDKKGEPLNKKVLSVCRVKGDDLKNVHAKSRQESGFKGGNSEDVTLKEGNSEGGNSKSVTSKKSYSKGDTSKESASKEVASKEGYSKKGASKEGYSKGAPAKCTLTLVQAVTVNGFDTKLVKGEVSGSYFIHDDKSLAAYCRRWWEAVMKDKYNFIRLQAFDAYVFIGAKTVHFIRFKYGRAKFLTARDDFFVVLHRLGHLYATVGSFYEFIEVLKEWGLYEKGEK